MCDAKMYAGISTMPLDRFIAMVCDGDLSALYVGGQRPACPDTEAEQARSEQLSTEFAEAFSGGDSGARLATRRKHELARLNIIILSCAVHIYGTPQFDDEIRNLLLRMRVRMNGVKDADLNVLNAALNANMRRLKETEESGDGKGLDREWFMDTLTSMSVWFKFNIPLEIPTVQFCDYHKAMKAGIRRRKADESKARQRRGAYR